MTTATENKVQEAVKIAEDTSDQLHYTTALLNTFIDQWDDLKRAAEDDRKDGDFWRLTSEFERVNGRIENLLNLTDDILRKMNKNGQSVINTLMELEKNGFKAD